MDTLIYYAACGIIAFIATFVLANVLINRLTRAGITGKDENKEGNPDVPEMGGISIVAGLSAGVLLAIFLGSFLGFQFNLIYVLGALITIHTIAFIGMTDDLLNIPQWLKAILPLFAAIPLVAVQAAGSTMMTIPFIGVVDFGIVYILLLIPLAIAVCSNLTNMLAGFNGLEAGMGAVIFTTLAALAVSHGSIEMSILTISMLGALLAFLYFNKFPARMFPGDVGTLTIGVAIAVSVIIGNIESAGMILMVPYVLDFFVKAVNKFPHTHQDIKDGKLYPKDGKVKGLVHVVMKFFKGISEPDLVLVFVFAEIVVSVIVMALFLRI
jgi:UDP-N-acetylglucosamine--dolichyl-phosphate N-acetylglucosaminephosphotransferase